MGVTEPRTCIGVWDAAANQRAACATHIAPGTDAQCARCAARDVGRALARDAHTDDRDYTLYLAYFGPGLVKVGLTATDRGHRRLLDQGALAHTVLGRGPLPAVRAAEKATAAAGFAVERLRIVTKTAAWWHIPPIGERRSAVEAARAAVATAGMLANIEPVQDTIHDHVTTCGLHHPPPSTYSVVTAVDAPAVVAVRLRAACGRLLLADDTTTGTTLLVDTRLLAGYRVHRANEPTTGLQTRPRGAPHDQPRLF